MFMADLCYIFIYIKWFINRLRVFGAIRSTKTILIEVYLLLNKYDEKNHYCVIIGLVFLKKKHLKAKWPSQITQSISDIAFEHETTKRW